MKYLSVALVVVTIIVGDIISDMGLMVKNHDRTWDFANSLAIVYAGFYFYFVPKE